MLNGLKAMGFSDDKISQFKARIKVFLYALFRFTLYGMIGVFAEVCQYTFVKVGRSIPVVKWMFQSQWRVDDSLNLNGIWDIPIKTLYGQCSLWMFPVYGLCAILLLERIYKFSVKFNLNIFIRGILYAIAITLFEFVSGFILYWLTGYKIWYYSDAANLLQMTSLFLFGVWFVTGLFVELIYRELSQKSFSNWVEGTIVSGAHKM